MAGPGAAIALANVSHSIAASAAPTTEDALDFVGGPEAAIALASESHSIAASAAPTKADAALDAPDLVGAAEAAIEPAVCSQPTCIPKWIVCNRGDQARPQWVGHHVASRWQDFGFSTYRMIVIPRRPHGIAATSHRVETTRANRLDPTNGCCKRIHRAQLHQSMPVIWHQHPREQPAVPP